MSYFNWTNITSPTDLFNYANIVTNNWFGLMLIISIFIILFISFKSYETEKAFSATTFISTIIALLLSLMGILSPEYVIIMIVLTAISVILLFFRPERQRF